MTDPNSIVSIVEVPGHTEEFTQKPSPKRGFAAMDRTRVREIARKGGLAAHRNGSAHEFNSEEARVAGRKGGLAAHANRQSP